MASHHPPSSGWKWNLAIAVTMAMVLVAMLPLVLTPLEWKAQLLLSVVLAVFAWLLSRTAKGHWATLVVMGLSIFLTTRYAYWRVTETLGFDDPLYHWYDFIFTFLLLSAELYAWIILLMGFIQSAWPLARKPVPIHLPPSEWPHVDVFIPTYNEPLSVVEPTIIAALHIDWPSDKLHVWVLDDGIRSEFRDFASTIGAGYIVRPEHKHAKAGNLNHALGLTKGEYVAIFDCDHVPARSFLQVTMGWMLRDPRIAMLQTPHHFYSPDPFERNLLLFKKVPNEGELFYGIVQDGNDLWNATFFCGSCAVMRRDALLEVGGIAVETVTEDAHTALRMQRRGWNTAYLNIPQAAGLATENLASHVGQRVRWARGMAQIFRIDNPLLGRGLSFWQRLCYLNAMAHFFFAFPRIVFLTAPLAYLLFDMRVLSAYALTFAAYSLPHIVMSNMANSRIQGRYRYSFWNEVYETVLAHYILLPTILAVVNPKLGKFNVTAKGGKIAQSFFDMRIARPYVVLWLLNVAGLCAVVLRLIFENEVETATVWMTGLWTLYNTIITGATLAVAREQRQERDHVRVRLRMPATLLGIDRAIPVLTENISDGGVAISSVDGMAIPPDKYSRLRLEWHGETHDLPVHWVAGDGVKDVARYRLGELALGQRVHLVRMLYTRADAWLGWTDGRAMDKPLSSLSMLAKFAFKGVINIAAYPFRKRNLQTLSLLVASGLFLSLWPHETRAEPVTGTVTVNKTGTVTANKQVLNNNFSRDWSLAQLGFQRSLRLTGMSNQQAIFFDVPQDRIVRSASVTVRLRHSPALLEKLSQINVFLNGAAVATWPVTPSRPDFPERSFSFAVDPYSLTHHNVLSFQLLGHYTLNCEDPAHSSIWAEILSSSSIHLEGNRLRLTDRLSRLPIPYLQRVGLGQAEPVSVYLPAGSGARMTEAAGVTASWLGVRARDYSPRFKVNRHELPPGHGIYFLNVAAGMPAWLNGFTLDRPTLAVRDHPGDPYSQVLLVAGRDEDEVLLAARALALGQYGMAGDQSTIVHLDLPEPRKALDAPRWLDTGRPVSLSELTTPDSLQVSGAGYASVIFQLAPDMFFWETKSIPLNLRYTYNPSPLGQQSTLAVNLNNIFAASAPMQGKLGAASHTEEQALALPAENFYPQFNKLDFYFGFLHAKEGECKDMPADTLRGAILADSTLDFSGIPHFAHLPNLALFSNGGYPYTRYADLGQTTVVLPEQVSDGALELYLSVLGQFGAQTGYPALRFNVVTSPEGLAGRDLLVVGEPDAMPWLSNWTERLPLRITSSGNYEMRGLGWSLWRILQPHRWWERDVERSETDRGHLLGIGGVPGAVIEQIVSPLDDRRTVTVLMASDQSGWNMLSSTLGGGEQRGGIYGNLAILNRDGVSRSFEIDAPGYDLGTLPWWTWLLWQLHRLPLLIVALVIVLVSIQGYVVSRWLKRRAKWRLEGRR